MSPVRSFCCRNDLELQDRSLCCIIAPAVSQSGRLINEYPTQMTPNEQIVEYWNRRSMLNEAEWEHFVRLLVALLMRTSGLPEAFAAHAQRKDAVMLFISDKVFLNAHTSRAGSLANAFALHGFFKRFCIDLLGRGKTDVVSIDADDAPQLDDTSGKDEEPGKAADELAGCFPLSSRQVLEEAGIDVDQAFDSARNFLRSLDEGDRVCLAYNTCEQDEDQVALNRLAERFSIRSYHYRAKQLGITGSKDGFYDGYESSRIGRWLTSLGARIAKDWVEELALLLAILCLQIRGEMENCHGN